MPTLTEVDKRLGMAIDRALQYYGFFRYPLKISEIRRACQEVCTEEEVRAYLNTRVAQGKAFALDGYYAQTADLPALLERRLKGNAKAERDIKKARRCGRFIYQFPFVRFVGISGSLSKGYSDERTDFDFFIVTAGNRLWICRTLLHLFKKLTFLAGRQHDYCMNYFIDEHALSLEEQNIYTATELSSIIPVCGAGTYQQLLQANAWVWNMLPNSKSPEAKEVYDANGAGKRILTACINLLHPAGLNRFFMWLTDTKWRRKWARKGYPAADYPLAFKTTLHISKNHPANYQKRILEELKPKDP